MSSRLWRVLYRPVDFIPPPWDAGRQAYRSTLSPSQPWESVSVIWTSGTSGGMPRPATQCRHVWAE